MKTKKQRFIVQVHFSWGWKKSGNIGANKIYTKESAQRRAAKQERKSIANLKYRIKEVR
jgi:hypothetical protein